MHVLVFFTSIHPRHFSLLPFPFFPTSFLPPLSLPLSLPPTLPPFYSLSFFTVTDEEEAYYTKNIVEAMEWWENSTCVQFYDVRMGVLHSYEGMLNIRIKYVFKDKLQVETPMKNDSKLSNAQTYIIFISRRRHL